MYLGHSKPHMASAIGYPCFKSQTNVYFHFSLGSLKKGLYCSCRADILNVVSPKPFYKTVHAIFPQTLKKHCAYPSQFSLNKWNKIILCFCFLYYLVTGLYLSLIIAHLSDGKHLAFSIQCWVSGSWRLSSWLFSRLIKISST